MREPVDRQRVRARRVVEDSEGEEVHSRAAVCDLDLEDHAPSTVGVWDVDLEQQGRLVPSPLRLVVAAEHATSKRPRSMRTRHGLDGRHATRRSTAGQIKRGKPTRRWTLGHQKIRRLSREGDVQMKVSPSGCPRYLTLPA
jgi:hypothetical protein